MFSAALPFPEIDPVALQLGPFAIHWYALAYIAGLILAWIFARRLVRANPAGGINEKHIEDLLFYATLGIILGGRLGYVLFYNLGFYLQHPLNMFMVWDGGMSFHGGLTGVILAVILFTRKASIHLWGLADVVATVAGFGLFLGRISNFINGELYGRATDVAWAMYFPHAPGLMPRHPSQLYEAFLEGIVLTALCFYLMSRKPIRAKEGTVAGVFLAGYAICRIFVEFYRQPDDHLGFLTSGLTMGQWLSIPMLLVGLAFIYRAQKAPAQPVTGYNA